MMHKRIVIGVFHAALFLAVFSTAGCGSSGGGGGGVSNKSLTLDQLLQDSGTSFQGSSVQQISSTAPSLPLYGTGGGLFLSSPYYSSLLADSGTFMRNLGSGISSSGGSNGTFMQSILGPYYNLFYGAQARYAPERHGLC